ncbi:hypothetical protein [Sinorhizobium sojae]|uniref:hypothetical protein n=1 Tax=Sinorhizobium sojae TaxID=716925 RepID=UPI0012F9A0CC|nr:hypothetical protein [Sinorhizobium sojae]
MLKKPARLSSNRIQYFVRDNWLDAIEIIKTLTTALENSARTVSDGNPFEPVPFSFTPKGE